MAKLFAGTSGFAYAGWKPAFYPAKLPSKRFLEYYSSRLNSVEVNFSFRRLIPSTTLDNWMSQAAPGFVFAPKAHQRITHFQRLKDSGEFTELFFKSLEPLRLAGRLGPVLFQLPPNMKADVSLLESFLAILPTDLRHAFEFRHTSWLTDEIYDCLKKHNAALCLAESEKLEIPEIVTAPFVYLRLRMSEYSREQLQDIAGQCSKWMGEGRDVFVYFKHEDTPDGALYAEEILKLNQGAPAEAAG